MNEDYLDNEEKEIMEPLKNLDLSNFQKPSSERQEMFKNAAAAFRKNETKMNIRIDELELQKIKDYASNEGLKYQTFVKSVLHKYITGQLVEKRKIS